MLVYANYFQKRNIKLFLTHALRGKHQGRKAYFLDFSAIFNFFTMCNITLIST